jgi:predicted DNA-binding transcriptional regulator YafY
MQHPKEPDAPSDFSKIPPMQMDKLSKIQVALTHSCLSYKQLAKEVGCSVSTARRGVEILIGAWNHPIVFDPKRNGWCYIEKTAPLPPIAVSESELSALNFTRKTMQDLRGTTLERTFASAFRKTISLLKTTTSRKLRRWNEFISFHTTVKPILKRQTFDTLAHALVDHERLEVLYRKPGQKIPEWRFIDALHLAKIDEDWFLFAFDHLRKQQRTFAPCRMLKIKRTGTKFAPRKFSLKARLRDCFNIISGRGKHLVIIRFKPHMADFIREKEWPCQKKLVELPDGGVELHLKVASLEEVQRWLMKWDQAEVVQPLELRMRVREYALALAAANA